MTVQQIADALKERGARDEALGAWRTRKVFGVQRPPVIDPVGRAWRLGSLLLESDGTLYSVGRVTRAIEPKDYNEDKTVAGEHRREERRAAVRGRFATGETVNFDVEQLDTENPIPPLAIGDGELLVVEGSVRTPLVLYLQDRAELLTER